MGCRLWGRTKTVIDALGRNPMSSSIFAGDHTGWIRDFEPGFRGKEEMTLTLRDCIGEANQPNSHNSNRDDSKEGKKKQKKTRKQES
jgi:hypothetical protein